MPVSMSSASLPVFQQMLGNLSYLLDKGLAHAQVRKFDPQILTSDRLAPDMLPFSRQVLIACDAAKLGVARITGLAAPKFEDTESTFEELKTRIAKTLAWLATVPTDKLDGTEDQDVTFPVGRDGTTRTMKAEAYLKHWVLPNMYFHITTAYAILRHNGVEVGKSDYLNGRV